MALLGGRARLLAKSVLLALALGLAGPAGATDIHFIPQGTGWDGEARALFYSGDVGSRLIPIAWLRALRQADGTPFIASLTRYGYLPNPDPANAAGLPVGFSNAASPQGRMAGLTCAACHTRQIVAGGTTFRIDGAPALVDQSAFLSDLDTAVGKLVGDEAAFRPFAGEVLGAGASDDLARDMLHAEVQYWWVRYHTLVAGTLPDGHASGHPWGPARMDSLAMTYNSLAGLAVGAAPTYLEPANVAKGDAPLRYPFLWNAGRQDFSRWTGIMEGGAPALALARGLGEMYGAFVAVRPMKTPGALGPLDRDYLTQNSVDIARLGRLDRALSRMGPPAWPWPVDQDLADRGKAIYARPASDGGCADCHGERPGLARPGGGDKGEDTWKTPVLDVGTDTRAWQVVLRETGTGGMIGASVPGSVPPLAARAPALDLLDIVVRGTIIDEKAKLALKYPLPALVVGAFAPATKAAPRGAPAPNRYEARVLHGIWAAAPYLHNGSVPTLADLLKPAAERPKRFAVGPNYDTGAVGLAAEQSMFGFTFAATGCEDRASGDSNCGHEYGTHLSAGDKKALLEYLKTL